MYGPVAGTGSRPVSRAGMFGGTGAVNSKAILSRKSGSGAVSRNVTVRAGSSTVTPRARSQSLPGLHAAAPAMPSRKDAAAGLRSRTRSIAYRKSRGRTGRPLEYRSPGRSVKVYTVPPALTAGMASARSGTSCRPLLPPVFWKVTSVS